MHNRRGHVKGLSITAILQIYRKEIIAEKGFRVKPASNTLMIPSIARGMRSISLRAEDENGLLPNWHWPIDTWENIEEENLLLALEIVCSLAEKIDMVGNG